MFKAHWGNIDFNFAFQTTETLNAVAHPSSLSLPLSLIVFFHQVFICYHYPAVSCYFCAFPFVFSLCLSLYFNLHFCYVNCHPQNFKVLRRDSDNGIMTGYTCYDYHHVDSLILCGVYYLHQGLVMFYTSRSVIKRTAQNHLSVPFFNFFFPSSLFVSLFLKLLYSIISPTLLSFSVLPPPVCLYPRLVSHYRHPSADPPYVLSPSISLCLCVLARSLWRHPLAVCLHWFALRAEDVIL